MSDSADLLSTCAGAGATLVAIVGGLLVSRYLTLESEALSARKLATSLADKLTGARERARESQLAHERFELREALTHDDVIAQFLLATKDGGLSVDAVAEVVADQGFGAETVAEATVEFNAEAGRVAAFDWGLVPHTDEHDFWYEFARKHDVHTEIEEMWEYLYIETCKERPAVQRSGFPMVGIDAATLGIVSVAEQNRRRDARNRLIDAREADRAEVQRLKAELVAAVTARDTLAQPPGLVAGLVVLAYLTVTSVIVPVLLLAPTPATLSYRESAAVVGLFVTGIVVLFAYLGSHVYRLLRASRDPVTSSVA